MATLTLSKSLAVLATAGRSAAMQGNGIIGLVYGECRTEVFSAVKQAMGVSRCAIAAGVANSLRLNGAA